MRELLARPNIVELLRIIIRRPHAAIDPQHAAFAIVPPPDDDRHRFLVYIRQSRPMPLDEACGLVATYEAACPGDRAWCEAWREGVRGEWQSVTFKYAGLTRFSGPLRVAQDEAGDGYGRYVRFCEATGVDFVAHELDLALEVAQPLDVRWDARIGNAERIVIALLAYAALNSAAGGPRPQIVLDDEIERLRALALAAEV